MKILLLVISLIFVYIVNAQDVSVKTKNQVKAKYFTAKEDFEKKDYNSTLVKIDEIDQLMNGVIIPTSQSLKIAALLNLNRFGQAKKELNILQNMEVSPLIIKEMASYSTRIEAYEKAQKEKELKAEKARILAENERLVEEQKERERLRKERLLREQKAQAELERKILEAKKESYKYNRKWSEGRLLIKIDGKYGYLIQIDVTKEPDYNGEKVWEHERYKYEIIIPCIYEDANTFSEGYARVRKNGKYGIIDVFGNTIIPIEFDRTSRLSNGFVLVEKNETLFILDKFGNQTSSFKNARIDYFKVSNDGTTTIKKWTGSKYLVALVNVYGNFIIDYMYEEIERNELYDDVVYYVKKDGKKGIINQDGDIIIPLEYEEITQKEYDNNILFYVKKNEKEGVIDISGKTVIPIVYEGISTYINEGLMVFSQNGKDGYMDVSGNIIIEAQFDDAQRFKEGYGIARVFNGKVPNYIGGDYYGKFGIINSKGEIIIPVEYDSLIILESSEQISGRKGDKSYSFDLEGNIL
jgi:hypothetical protein